MENSRQSKTIENLTKRLGLVSEIITERLCRSVRRSIWKNTKNSPKEKQVQSNLVGIKLRHVKRTALLANGILDKFGSDQSYHSLMDAICYRHDDIRFIEALEAGSFDSTAVTNAIYNKMQSTAINNFIAEIASLVKNNSKLNQAQKSLFLDQIDKKVALKDSNKILAMLIKNGKVTDSETYWAILEKFILTNISDAKEADNIWKSFVEVNKKEKINSFYFKKVSTRKALEIINSEYVTDHASFAGAMLFERKGVDSLLDILDLSKYQKERIKRVMYGAIAFHQMDITRFPESHQKQISLPEDEWILKSNVFELILNENTNEEVLGKIASLFAQIMRDVDKVDILVQNKTKDMLVIGDTEKFKTFSLLFEKDGSTSRKYLTFNQFLELHGLTKETLLKYYPNFDITKLDEFANLGEIKMDKNGLDLVKPAKAIDSVEIPLSEIPIEKLQVPEDMKKLFYDEVINTFGGGDSLRILMGRADWNRFCGMWWRLQAFLTDVNFIQTLMVVEDNHILDDILAQYPDAYKPLVLEAFEHAKRKYLDQAIANNKGNVYYIKRAS